MKMAKCAFMPRSSRSKTSLAAARVPIAAKNSRSTLIRRGDSIASAEEDAGGVDTVLEKMANVPWSAKRLRRRAGAVFRPTF